MSFWFLLGVVFLGILVLLGRWFATAQPRHILHAAKIVGLIAILAGMALLVLSGRLAWALAAIPAAAVWVLRFYSVAQIMRRVWVSTRNWTRMSGGAPSGRTSAVETAMLRVTLDHDSGEMAGLVTKGAFEGRELFTLDDGDMDRLLAECRSHDAESAQVLEAYLDRMRPGWRASDSAENSQKSAASFTEGAMDEAEALRILGLGENADAAAVKAAHRRLMAALHPDHGGSTYLAAKINQAKDVLLRRK